MGKTFEIEATYKDTGRKCMVNYDFGEDVNEAVEKFGAEVVHTNFIAQAKVRAQAIMRDLMEKGKTDEEIQNEINAWKPGIQRARTVDALATVQTKFNTMSDEEKAAFIADLQAGLLGKKAPEPTPENSTEVEQTE
jgi:hypothetical protein